MQRLFGLFELPGKELVVFRSDKICRILFAYHKTGTPHLQWEYFQQLADRNLEWVENDNVVAKFDNLT